MNKRLVTVGILPIYRIGEAKANDLWIAFRDKLYDILEPRQRRRVRVDFNPQYSVRLAECEVPFVGCEEPIRMAVEAGCAGISVS